MSLGSICLTPIAPWVADKYGRRMGITVGKLIMIIGAILQCESHNFGMFFGSRFVLGFAGSEEAAKALKQYHGEGGETKLVRLEFEEIRAAIDHEKRSGTTTWPSMVRTKGNRYRMFLVVCMGFMSQWSGNGLVAYYLSRVMDTVGITDKNTQALVNGLINIWNFGLALTARRLICAWTRVKVGGSCGC
ncbi:hypothetical protein VD0002_g4466 [Verticillium dahliae]|nr:hypothetical protein VD0004_g6814 [Verticillium dahliae]PNH64097.1 hypothetical protein VD0002_g4466 [Verticillium dahliae]RBQ80134.1 hypothetical protein VDGD_09835 [Verticillium dahliae]